MLRSAVTLAGAGEVDRAARILSDALHQWPNHPGLLAGLAGVRLRQGRPAEAEVLADLLIRVDPASDHGWELLAASRYLQDDTRGALRAWRHLRPPVVREMEVRVLAYNGPRVSDTGTDPTRLTGIAKGRSLTVEELVRGERRLEALPAAWRARLGYRALPGRDAALDGTVVLGAGNPFTWSGMVAHGLRALVGRVYIVSSDPLGRLERWEFSGDVRGTTHSVALALAHPAPLPSGVWRWVVEHETGRYGSFGRAEAVSERRSGVEWSHTDWVTASLRGSVHGRVDARPGRGTFAGVGLGWTLLSLSGRSSIRLEGTGWTKVGGSGDGAPDQATRFGRVALDAAIHPADPPGMAGPSGLSLRAGILTISPGAPHDLFPRIGAGGTASLLMRARSDLDDDGVVRPLFPGRTWLHGGVEVLRSVGALGPVGFGVAAFVDGVRVLGPAPGAVDPAQRRGAVHLGGGMRLRVPVVAGWLRADWGIDPVDGASTISLAWVFGASR
ncbi:MAG: tetratricopeptide repeat protein [Longimicrobiales bacterium]|nr:tetratricopeptide repeat protein [Longimicrobiales bacterium]